MTPPREMRGCAAGRFMLVSALAGFAFAVSAKAHSPDDLTVFLEALTASQEAVNAIDPLIESDDRIRLLLALARGDTAEVVDAVLGLAEGRAMEELERAVPFLGKAIMARDAGLWLSEYVWDHAATRGFENARARISEAIPRENWPRDWESYRASGHFDAELFRSFLTHESMVFTNAVWREHGIDNARHPDAERVLFEAFWNRVLVEDAFDASGLTGRARTAERLRAWLEAEIAFRQELALMSADSWREHLLFLESVEVQARENSLARRAEVLAGEAPVAPADEAEEAEIAIAIEIEAMAIEMETPALAMALEGLSQPDPPALADAAAPAVAGLSISHGTHVRGETTQHSVIISHDDDVPATVFLSLAALGAATSGGLGHGSIPEILSLGAGDSWAIEIMVMGDHPGAMLSVGRGAESMAQLVLLPAHEIEGTQAEPPQPDPPAAPLSPQPDDPEAIWLAAPVVFSGHQRVTYRLSVGGQTHSADWVVPDVTYSFSPGGELRMAHGGYTALLPSHTMDQAGEVSFLTEPMPIDPAEQVLGQVSARNGQVNIRELIDLGEQQMSEAGIRFDGATSWEITADRVTGGIILQIPYPQGTPPVLLRIESELQLNRTSGGTPD